MSLTKKEKMKFKTSYAYFTADGSELVVYNPRTPRPWMNPNCNENYGYVVSQNGSGFSWYGNSQLARMNIWHQDLIQDDMGKYIYVRDNDSKKIWSTTWKPTCFKYKRYQARFGLGYSKFVSDYNDVHIEQLQFVPRKDSVEVYVITLTNTGTAKKNLSLFSYLEWCLGNGTDTHREFQKTFIETHIDRNVGAVYATKRPALVPAFISTGAKDAPLSGFASFTNVKADAYDGDKETFMGMYNDIRMPKAVIEGQIRNRRETEKWGDACAALQINIALEAGETKEIFYVMGRVEQRPQVAKFVAKYSKKETILAELKTVTDFWKNLTEASWIDTPDEAMNFLTNKWYRYQALAARMWGKTAYYQCSGGLGYRDQLQDSNCFLEVDPKITKAQILLHAEQMWPDGTVFHWWHPGTGIGAHTEMVDDMLWLALLTMNYIDETADYSILDVVASYVVPKRGAKQEKGTIYNHCIRSFEKVFSRWSPRGLPLMGEGDWNDGMSHVGVHWKGESIWLGHFFYGILVRFSLLCEYKKDAKRAKYYLDRAAKLKDAINKHAWDGQWYIRATRDNGVPLGSKTERRGKIFLNAQVWAVINKTATPERARIAMNSAYKYLYREYGPLLFTPGYDKIDTMIGYLSRYAPSVRENGGVYTHAACWGVQAAAIMGDSEIAYNAYRSMCPIYRSLDNAEKYYAEPNATPGNVDGPDSPNFGRGGWTWYSGSGSWMQKVAYNWICGIRASQNGLIIDPCIPKEWKGFTAKRTFRGSVYMIQVKNPKRIGKGVKQIIVDGKKISGMVIPPFKDRKTHNVVVVMG